MTKLQAAIAIAIVMLAAFRFAMNASTKRVGEMPTAIADQQRLVFDSEAAVILTVGPDGAPGIAGKDEGFPPNGVIDDRSELGAVGSDDVCLAPWNAGYAEAVTDPNSAVASRGSFRAVDDFDPSDTANGQRWIVESDHRTWMIVSTSQSK